MAPSKQPLQVLGQFKGNLTHKSKSVAQQVFVVTGLKTNLLGLPAITALNLAARVDSTSSTPTNVHERFPAVFKGLGNLGEEYEFQLKPGVRPYSLFTPRHVPLPLRAKVKEELCRMESLGVIS
jgi:tRNA(Met) C34 N-acetyltransferase TmcA